MNVINVHGEKVKSKKKEDNTPSTVVDKLVLSIQEFLCWILWPDTISGDQFFPHFLFFSSRKCFKSRLGRFFPDPLQFIFHWSLYQP